MLIFFTSFNYGFDSDKLVEKLVIKEEQWNQVRGHQIMHDLIHPLTICLLNKRITQIQ